MAIAFRSYNSNNTDNTTSMVITKPAGTVDDDVLIFWGSCDGLGYDLPSGFTHVLNVATGGTHTNRLAFKVASSEGASYTITSSASERGIGIIEAYSGVNILDVIDLFTSNIGGADATAVLLTLTPSTDNCAVLGFVGLESGNAGNPVASTWPNGLISRCDNVNGPPGTGNGSSAGSSSSVIQTTAGAVVGNVALSGGSTFWGAMSVSLNPAAIEGITSVTPDTFDMVETSIDIVGANFEATQGTGKLYISDANTLAGSANEVELVINTWADLLVNVDLTDTTLASLQTLGPGIRYMILVNDTGDEYPSDAVTLSRPPAFEMALGAATPGTTTSRLTGLTGTFGGGRIEEVLNPSTTNTDVAEDGYREDVWSIQATTESIDGAQYEFRTLLGGAVISTYTVTPKVTIGTTPPPTGRIMSSLAASGGLAGLGGIAGRGGGLAN